MIRRTRSARSRDQFFFFGAGRGSSTSFGAGAGRGSTRFRASRRPAKPLLNEPFRSSEGWVTYVIVYLSGRPPGSKARPFGGRPIPPVLYRPKPDLQDTI